MLNNKKNVSGEIDNFVYTTILCTFVFSIWCISQGTYRHQQIYGSQPLLRVFVARNLGYFKHTSSPVFAVYARYTGTMIMLLQLMRSHSGRTSSTCRPRRKKKPSKVLLLAPPLASCCCYQRLNKKSAGLAD